MNRDRRKELKKTITHLDDVITEIDFLYDEESEALDNYPENLQGSDKYDALNESCEILSDAINDLNEVKDLLEELL